MVDFFIDGKTINEISQIYNFTKLTVSRNIKILIGESEYKRFLKKNKENNEINFENTISQKSIQKDISQTQESNNTYLSETEFFEIVPLDSEISYEKQKDFASSPISEVSFPKIVYMVVDKKIELETKLLKDYPNWRFLSEEELNRKVIEIHYDLKTAKRSCSKDQRVLKVPNPEVFKTVAPKLVARGISRIIASEQLISL